MKAFGPFLLDVDGASLWRGDTRISLTPKALSVLLYLVERPGTLIPQTKLLEELWPDTFVQPEVLKTQIRDLRLLLGDDARAPQYIETQHRRGYRFIATVSERNNSTPASLGTQNPAPATCPTFVGRENVVRRLETSFRRACSGEPQLIFLTGEGGIGKTSVLKAFEQRLQNQRSGAVVITGQSVEGFGSSEPYYPILEAFGSLLRMPAGQDVLAAMAQYAPTWLAQFPAFLTPKDKENLYRDLLGANRERMLRELCELMANLAAETPLVIMLEDVHWADSHTIDWLSSFARTRRTPKLLVVASFRPIEIALTGHPLKRLRTELVAGGLCQEISLSPLTRQDIHAYLEGRSPDGSAPAQVTDFVLSQSEGNPLFMKLSLEHLLAHSLVTEDDGRWISSLKGDEIDEVPETLRELVESQLDAKLQLPEREILEAASTCGVMFSIGCMAAGIGKDPEDIEAACLRLGHEGHFIRRSSSAAVADSQTGVFEFIHSAYRDVLYKGIPSSRRARIHRQIGEAMEIAHSTRLEQIASQLVYHFEQCADLDRVARYLLVFAVLETKRFAFGEAANAVHRAIKLLESISHPTAPFRRAAALYQLAEIYTWEQDYGRAKEALHVAEKACIEAGANDLRIRILLHLSFVYCRMDAPKCIETSCKAVELSQASSDLILRKEAQMAQLFWQVVCDKWDADAAAACNAAANELREQDGAVSFAQGKMMQGMLNFLSSDYEEGLANLETGIRVLSNIGASSYQGAALNEVWLLLFSGRWGDAIEKVQFHLATGTSSNPVHNPIWTVQLARIYFYALDLKHSLQLFDEARTMLESRNIAAMLRTCLAMQARTQVAIGEDAKAQETVDTVRSMMGTRQTLLDWYYVIPLLHTETELAIKSGDGARAQQCAQQLLDASMGSGEFTWQALAWETSARMWLQSKDRTRAQECIDEALLRVQSKNLPLVEWQVHRTAMRVRPDHREEHRALALAAIARLSDSLGSHPIPQQTFRSTATAEIDAAFHMAATEN